MKKTDLDVTDLRFVLVQDCIHSKEFYRDAHFLLLNYTCRCAGQPAVKLNEELVAKLQGLAKAREGDLTAVVTELLKKGFDSKAK